MPAYVCIIESETTNPIRNQWVVVVVVAVVVEQLALALRCTIGERVSDDSKHRYKKRPNFKDPFNACHATDWLISKSAGIKNGRGASLRPKW